MRRRLGYTLTELMIVVAILGTIFTVAPMLLTQLQNFYLMTSARSDIERDARASLDLIDRFVRQAVDGTIIIDTPSGEGPYSRIRFKLVDGRSVDFHQNGNQLVASIDGNTSIVSSNLVYIAFTFPRSDDPSIVSISLTMGKSIQLGRKKVLELTVQQVRVMN
ncbi:MAG: prepilin-type N-terminal cleavage/methylation domain-containing protein [Elusimicrobia bacterium]|nr:prepilin-type N-terminal cleavage/methylation domain-containing protein [Elusimicrobiota bacterium]MDE2426463.1 prepilin-type N-terminal cleavage/methylation domain-containing protein [Elusimicrobiota bacterium]